MSSRASVASSRVPALHYQPQETPLGNKAFDDLDRLKRQGLQRDDLPQNARLDVALNKAAEYLRVMVAEINERASEEKIRRNNRLERMNRDGGSESATNKRKFDDYQKKIANLTQKMDEGIREVIDHQTFSQQVPESVNHIITTSKDRQRLQRAEAEQDDDDDADRDQINSRANSRTVTESASILFKAVKSTAESQWTTQTLTQRYASNETYEIFYKLKFDAQNPGETQAPVPHRDLWFAAEEGRTSQRNTQQDDQNDQEMDDDSEIEIGQEKVSCKCPLTLQYFVEPVTSTKCRHSFEKKAILELLENSPDRVPLSTEQQAAINTRFPRGGSKRTEAEEEALFANTHIARCPERGCHVILQETDFKANVVLQRKAERVKKAERLALQAEADGSDDSDDGFPHTQRRRRIVPIGSSPASSRKRVTVKGERSASVVVPDSQTTSNARRNNRRQRAMDVDDMDDEMED